MIHPSTTPREPHVTGAEGPQISEEDKYKKKFFAESLAAVGWVSMRRSRDICAEGRKKKHHYIVRQDFYIRMHLRIRRPCKTRRMPRVRNSYGGFIESALSNPGLVLALQRCEPCNVDLTRLGESGADAFEIMRIAGHSTVTISQRYMHPSPEALERAFKRLESLNRKAASRLTNREKRRLPATVSATLDEASMRAV